MRNSCDLCVREFSCCNFNFITIIVIIPYLGYARLTTTLWIHVNNRKINILIFVTEFGFYSSFYHRVSIIWQHFYQIRYVKKGFEEKTRNTSTSYVLISAFNSKTSEFMCLRGLNCTKAFINWVQCLWHIYYRYFYWVIKNIGLLLRNGACIWGVFVIFMWFERWPLVSQC